MCNTIVTTNKSVIKNKHLMLCLCFILFLLVNSFIKAIFMRNVCQINLSANHTFDFSDYQPITFKSLHWRIFG